MATGNLPHKGRESRALHTTVLYPDEYSMATSILPLQPTLSARREHASSLHDPFRRFLQHSPGIRLPFHITFLHARYHLFARCHEDQRLLKASFIIYEGRSGRLQQGTKKDREGQRRSGRGSSSTAVSPNTIPQEFCFITLLAPNLRPN